MAIDEVFGQDWTRKHDDPATPVVRGAPRTVYPKSLEELIEICSTRKPSEKIHAAGSHWALSGAAISDSVFVETHDPNNVHQAMGRTLYDVVGGPGCLNPAFIDALKGQKVRPFDTNPANISNVHTEGLYPIHIETGKRIYQAYSELDVPDDDPRSLAVYLDTRRGNSTYLGPWAFKTLGGAGGQTVFGALTTGTHGGDFLIDPASGMRQPPIADSVLALHLVADGGMHYWIEPESAPPLGVPLTDRSRVEALYGQARYGGSKNFEFIRDDNLFNAVLIAAGRFGIVYSIVVAAVRQYCLHHERRLTTWQAIKGQINDPTSALYTGNDQASAPPSPNKYLNIVVSVTPFDNFSQNLAGVAKAWNVPLAEIPPPAPPGTPAGRPERRGSIIRGLEFDAMIQAPRFEFAGNSSSYKPDPKNPGLTLSPDVLGLACTNADFLEGVIDIVKMEIDTFVKTSGATVGTTIAVVVTIATVATAGAALAVLLIALLAILPILAALLLLVAALPKPLRLGHVMNLIQRTLLNPAFPPGSPERIGGLLAWQAIANQVFSDQQKRLDAKAISYAAMDGKDYLEKSCSANADSIEVFFDATDPMLVAYVDGLLAYEVAQEVAIVPSAFVGYISLRFTGRTRALLGQQRFPLSCAVEVSGVRDVTGVTAFMDFAISLALDSNFKGILHWGQRNESMRAHVQERFGDTGIDPTGDLRKWRDALSTITQNGKLDGFSNEFTRQTGLEIVTPIIGNLTASGSDQSQPITIRWDCDQNPPATPAVVTRFAAPRTEISLRVVSPSGVQSSFVAQPLLGQLQVAATESGVYSVSLVAAIDFDGERREATQQVVVTIA